MEHYGLVRLPALQYQQGAGRYGVQRLDRRDMACCYPYSCFDEECPCCCSNRDGDANPACHSLTSSRSSYLLCVLRLLIKNPIKKNRPSVPVPFVASSPSRALAVSVRRQCDALVLIPPPNPTLIYFYGLQRARRTTRTHSTGKQLLVS
ncbi:hypothetical protein V8C42DRAFT_319529 [Trichoderma barbatum]